MKRIIICMFVALFATVTVKAQQIAVVTGNTTKMCQTLKDAIEASSNGSVIYLPGGGFQISDDVKITKRVSIIGIGHKANGDNADGNTVISGNLFFNEGSDGSAVMGCYISGNVSIGTDSKSVNNILIKFCNLNAVYVWSNLCTGTIINQNYIRNSSNFQYASSEFTNNVAHSISYLHGGKIENNIFTYFCAEYSGTLNNCDNCSIINNILFTSYNSYYHFLYSSGNCLVSGNMTTSYSCGDDPVFLEGVSWNDVFENYNNAAISPASDFHFKKEYQKYSECGIYGGTGFSDKGMAPVPYIMAKDIPDQTDASGKLNIKIRVKASE